MAESKIINNAARILRLVQSGTPADQALRDSLTQNRHFTAPLERREISRAVFAYFRWWRWLSEKDSLQKQLEAGLVFQERFNKNPASFKPEGLAARVVPDWLKDEMDSIPVEWLRQLQREPVLWIRAKTGTSAALAKKLVTTEATPHSPDALRYTGIKDLYRTPEFQAGEFEIQDLASQLVSLAAAPQPGEMWWDACAGEGGKSMHLSDLMQNKGTLWVSDRSARRLDKLKDRASRASVFNYRAVPWEGGTTLPTKTKFDGVLVDAPCSGVGTWQRNPHARWTTTPKDVHELAVVQKQLLENIAGSLKSGGRLVYAVCTLTRAETTGIAENFNATHPEFEPLSAKFLWPQELNANGMFIAQWRKK
ncbi:RsmB/NOP family class I SAM-dependent RNA methyltransferase [Oleiharenicola lentus]|uniref:RsmB/NOP family class I SAM-dependent RNA methyltransferase n=1 Tax=Oleiharenicola lentus TaxID=2508720 RepID=UPI003F680878